MRSVFGAACVCVFLAWDFIFNHAAITLGFADEGHRWLTVLWQLIV